jgi:cytochrome c oxidase subunit 2
MSQQCASCHTIAGTPAQGRIGPNLTHIASRATLAALTIPNDPGHLAAWIHDPQQVKPGNKMPGLQLGPQRLQAIVSYLGSLR